MTTVINEELSSTLLSCNIMLLHNTNHESKLILPAFPNTQEQCIFARKSPLDASSCFLSMWHKVQMGT